MLSLTQGPGTCDIFSVVAVDGAVAKYQRELVTVIGAGFLVQDAE